MVLAEPTNCQADLTILPGRHDAAPSPFVLVLKAPRWQPPRGSEVKLAEVYRRALAEATERGARSLVLAPSLTDGPWPMDDVTRVALTVLMSTPSSVREVTIAAATPGMVEIWAEALVREP